MRDIFGEDSFYLELQDHGIADQTEVNRQLLRLHNETGIPLVCTNDAHYLQGGRREPRCASVHPDGQDRG